MISNIEVWRVIGGLDGRYEVSNLGRIRNLSHQFAQKSNWIYLIKASKWIRLSRVTRITGICNKGHERLTVVAKGKVIGLRVNRVVATAFLPNPLNLPYVRNKDGNKLNNRVENLEWNGKRQKKTTSRGSYMRRSDQLLAGDQCVR